MDNKNLTTNNVNTEHEESFAMELLTSLKTQFKVVVTVLSVIILILFGIIIYDAYIDSQYETIEYIQDGTGYNNINTGTQGDVTNGTENENETPSGELQY